MKYLFISLSFVVLTLFLTLYLLFTQSGNNIIKPYLETVIEKKLQKNVHVETFTLKTNFIDLEFTVEKDSRFIINGNLNLKKRLFDLEYIVKTKNLTIYNINLNEPLHVAGKIKGNMHNFQLNGTGKTLEAQIKFLATVENKDIKDIQIDAKKIELSHLSKILKYPKYTDGELEFTIDIKDVKKQSRDGTINLLIKNGVLHVEELMSVKNSDKINYKLHLISKIEKNSALINTKLISNAININIDKSTYDLKKKILKGEYNLDVEDLNNLHFLTNRPLKGNLQINGNYKYDNQIYLNGTSNFLDAKTNFTLKNNLLNLNSDELSIVKITDMLYYPRVFNSFSTLKVDYNLTNKTGEVSLNALNGQLIKNNLTKTVDLASGFDLTSEMYKDSLLRGVIDKNKIDFSLIMNGLEGYFKILDGYINLETDEIDSKFDIKIQHMDFKGTIKGKLNKPDIKLSDSIYIKNKIDKAIEKNIPKEWQDTAKELLELFGT
ncbi:MAG: hypothetical protein JJV94_05385 [Sulfurospirillum sp.]|nr:hypothetical protein [Sulfurospirillum sp.]